MITNKFGEIVYNENDLVDLLMQGFELKTVIVDDTVSIPGMLLENTVEFLTPTDQSIGVDQFDQSNQQCWFMPEEYKNFDIAKHLLNLCKTDAELQRVGKELLLYNEKNLFDLLRYLKYLVDTMKQNNIIWGVGRGSSVASYVLYLLEVHKVDSIYYDLDPEEFLR